MSLDALIGDISGVFEAKITKARAYAQRPATDVSSSTNGHSSIKRKYFPHGNVCLAVSLSTEDLLSLLEQNFLNSPSPLSQATIGVRVFETLFYSISWSQGDHDGVFHRVYNASPGSDPISPYQSRRVIHRKNRSSPVRVRYHIRSSTTERRRTSHEGWQTKVAFVSVLPLQT